MDKLYRDNLEHEAQSIEQTPIAPGEIIIGELVGFNESGEPQVIFPGSGNLGLTAISTVAITHDHKGRQAALLFANADLAKPVIIGLIYSPLLDMLDKFEFIADTETCDEEVFIDTSIGAEQKVKQTELNTVYVDGNRVVMEGKEEIVLKCGEASITLTKAGKILIRGKYLLNRSSGVNRIMGGSVQVN